MVTNTGGEMLLFSALARNMALMTTAPYAFLNEVDPLCSLYSLVGPFKTVFCTLLTYVVNFVQSLKCNLKF